MDRITASVILLAALLAATPAPAQEPGPHAQIRSLLQAVNESFAARDAAALSRLFAPHGDFRAGAELHATTAAALDDFFNRRPAWSETTLPRIGGETIHFVTPGIALVEAVQVQYGSLILRQSTPVLMLLRNNGTAWRIVSLRIFQPL